MINPTRIIEITAVLYLPQFMKSTDKHDNDDFYVTRERLRKMYLVQYSRNYIDTAPHSFKVAML